MNNVDKNNQGFWRKNSLFIPEPLEDDATPVWPNFSSPSGV
jgi:hypothetical protein